MAKEARYCLVGELSAISTHTLRHGRHRSSRFITKKRFRLPLARTNTSARNRIAI